MRMVSFIFSVLFLSSGLILASSPRAAADEYEIDPDHSLVSFKVRHLAISSVLGQFDKFKGVFNFDPKNFGASMARASIDVSSINTNQNKRDDHLRSDDFFSAAKFPEITFVSKKIEGVSPDNFKLIGDLTMRGVTKEVELDVEMGGQTKDPWGNDRVAFSASTKLNRRDFGLSWSKILETGTVVVGDEVKIELEIEGVKKKEA